MLPLLPENPRHPKSSAYLKYGDLPYYLEFHAQVSMQVWTKSMNHGFLYEAGIQLIIESHANHDVLPVLCCDSHDPERTEGTDRDSVLNFHVL
jgi:hypothetical protein